MEIWMVRRVREVLRLQAESRVLFVGYAVLSFQTPIEKVAGIKLYTGLGRQDLESATAYGFVESRRESKRAIPIVQNKIVIVAACHIINL